jgi:hypothetical protein
MGRDDNNRDGPNDECIHRPVEIEAERTPDTVTVSCASLSWSPHSRPPPHATILLLARRGQRLAKGSLPAASIRAVSHMPRRSEQDASLLLTGEISTDRPHHSLDAAKRVRGGNKGLDVE